MNNDDGQTKNKNTKFKKQNMTYPKKRDNMIFVFLNKNKIRRGRERVEGEEKNNNWTTKNIKTQIKTKHNKKGKTQKQHKKHKKRRRTHIGKDEWKKTKKEEEE